MAAIDDMVAQGLWANAAAEVVALDAGTAGADALTNVGFSIAQVETLAAAEGGTADASTLVAEGFSPTAAAAVVSALAVVD